MLWGAGLAIAASFAGCRSARDFMAWTDSPRGRPLANVPPGDRRWATDFAPAGLYRTRQPVFVDAGEQTSVRGSEQGYLPVGLSPEQYRAAPERYRHLVAELLPIGTLLRFERVAAYEGGALEVWMTLEPPTRAGTRRVDVARICRYPLDGVRGVVVDPAFLEVIP